MPDRLDRRCPECLNADADVACPSYKGARFVPTGLTLEDLAKFL